MSHSPKLTGKEIKHNPYSDTVRKFLVPGTVGLRGGSKDFIKMLRFELSLKDGVFKLKNKR